MPSTTYIDFTALIAGIGARTNNVGAAQPDVSAEEFRLPNPSMFDVEGALSDSAWKLVAASGMNMTLGSGTSKADRAVVFGDTTGEGNYLVALAQSTVTVTVPASDPSQARTDELYLVVLDSAYDGNTLGTASAPLSLPRLGYRKGDAGGGAPGPDSLWKSSWKIASVVVGAAVSSIAAGNITDARTFAVAIGANPPGAVADFLGNTVPNGWLECDGSAISRATYARLFAAIGTTHGVGDGSTTYNLPNHKGRLSVGRDSGDADFDTVGETHGAKTKTIDTTNLPAHAHAAGTFATALDGTHGHFKFKTNIAAGTALVVVGDIPVDEPDAQTADDYGRHSHSITGSTANTGGGAALDVLNPVIVVRKIIRT